MDLKKSYVPPKKPIHEITITRWSNGEITFDFLGLKCRAEVMPLLRLCDREVRRRLSTGQLLNSLPPSVKGDEMEV